MLLLETAYNATLDPKYTIIPNYTVIRDQIDDPNTLLDTILQNHIVEIKYKAISDPNMLQLDAFLPLLPDYAVIRHHI